MGGVVPPESWLMAGVAIMGSLLGYVMLWFRKLGSRISAAEGDAKTAEWRSKVAAKEAEKANARVDVINRDLADYKMAAGETLAEIKGIAENTSRNFMASEARMVKALDDLGDRFDQTIRDMREDRPHRRT